MAASHSATWLAFGSIAKRSLSTFTTPARRWPQRPSFLPPHHTLVSKATKGRRIDKNHFTSHRPHRAADDQQRHQKQQKEHHDDGKQGKNPKRKAAQRSKGASTSLARVAVEAQRSRGSLIKGYGKTRHVDPEAETKDVTAYCAAEKYNVHVARDLLRQQGWNVDPYRTELFPQVLHVQTKVIDDGKSISEQDTLGDALVFPSGSVVTWNISEKVAHQLVERVLVPAAENPHPEKLEAEDLEYLEDPTRETSEIIGDTIILGTKTLDFPPDQQPTDPTEHRPEVDTILAKIAFSSALARSTKLAVLEETLSHYFHTTHDIPATFTRGNRPRFTRAFILRKTGELLHIRAQLNLYSELTDSLPDLFWDSPHELGLENYYEQVGRVLDVNVRIKILNEKIDYASEIAQVLRERLSENHSHLLEWIIIWLILIEVAYGTHHLWKEWQEKIDPESDRNLMRAYLTRELGK